MHCRRILCNLVGKQLKRVIFFLQKMVSMTLGPGASDNYEINDIIPATALHTTISEAMRK